MESDSDLTDNLSDEFQPQTAKKSSYKIRNSLRPPHTNTYAAEMIYRWIHQGRINLEPDYQREVVWPDSKQTKLIDSLLRNFYVPPVIFHRVTDSDGTVHRTCIDGKQRLTSIQRFMDGIIPHSDAESKKKFYFKNLSGQGRRNILPDELKDAMKDKQITCIEYDEINETYEREIFQRVQLGMPLRPAERMLAVSGPWATLVNEMKTKYLVANGGLLDYINLNVSRAQDYLAIAQVVYGVDRLPNRATFLTPDVEKWLGRTDPPTLIFKNRIRAIFEQYLKLAKTWDKQRVSPVEFVMISLIVANHVDEPVDVISQHAQNFRKIMKASHQDLRVNSKVIKTAYNCIEDTAKTIKKSGKRKKGDSDDESDDEYRGSPIIKQGKAAATRRQGMATSTSPTKAPLAGNSKPSLNNIRSTSQAKSPVGPSRSPTVKVPPSANGVSPLKAAQSAPSQVVEMKPDVMDAMTFLKSVQSSRAAPEAAPPPLVPSTASQPNGNQASAQPPPPLSSMRRQSSGMITPTTPVASGYSGQLGAFFAAGTSQSSLQGQSAQPQPYNYAQSTQGPGPPGIPHPQQGRDARYLPGYRPGH